MNSKLSASFSGTGSGNGRSRGKWLKAQILDSLHLTRDLLREQWPILTAILIFSCLLNINLEDALQASAPAEDNQRLMFKLVLATWELFEGLLLIIVLSWGIPKVHNMHSKALLADPFSSPYLKSFFAEYLRLLAQMLMWAILLLIPGFVRYCQLIFVPFIALFSSSYRKGEADALRLSEQLVRGRLMIIVTIMVVLMALGVMVEFLPQMVTELHSLPWRVAFAVVSLLISVWTYSFVFLIFEEWISEEQLSEELRG